jgi:hypothetical protein
VLTVIIFLCTWLKLVTNQDKRKLERVLGYLSGTERWTLLLKPPKSNYGIEVYVGAACALNSASKSQTGVIIHMGGAMVFASFKKQKCGKKSNEGRTGATDR